MPDNIALATAALKRLLSRHPELLADTAYMNDFCAGYIAACEAIDSGDDIAVPSTANEAFAQGYEEAMRDVGLL